MTMTDELIKRLRSATIRLSDVRSAADRIEALTADRENRLADLRIIKAERDNLKREVAISDALLISEAEVSLERLARAEKAEAERDEAYANGYSDAETEVSKSALGQRNDFLHSQYANAADRIEALTAQLQVSNELGRALEEDAGQLREDNARLLEIVRDALDAWDTHNKYGDPMQGHWASDARAALNGKETSHE
jgi:hypothetical protein